MHAYRDVSKSASCFSQFSAGYDSLKWSMWRNFKKNWFSNQSRDNMLMSASGKMSPWSTTSPSSCTSAYFILIRMTTWITLALMTTQTLVEKGLPLRSTLRRELVEIWLNYHFLCSIYVILKLNTFKCPLAICTFKIWTLRTRINKQYLWLADNWFQ